MYERFILGQKKLQLQRNFDRKDYLKRKRQETRKAFHLNRTFHMKGKAG